MKQRYGYIATAFFLLTFLLSPTVKAQVTVSGAGSAVTNGTYNQSADVNGKNGYLQVANPDFEVSWSGAQWQIDDTFFGVNTYYTNTTDCGSQPPDTGWAVGPSGTAPTPSVTGDICGLDVELTSFEASSNGEAVSLTWQTASETNNAGFEVQHALNNEARNVRENWENLGFIEGFGTTNTPRSYSFKAEDLTPGRHFFRLKQTDFDGAFTFTPEVETVIEAPEGYHLSPAYPNPFNPSTAFTMTVSKRQQVEVAVYDVLGQQVALLHDGPLQAKEAHRFEFRAEALPSGTYIIRAMGKNFTTTRQVLLVK